MAWTEYNRYGRYYENNNEYNNYEINNFEPPVVKKEISDVKKEKVEMVLTNAEQNIIRKRVESKMKPEIKELTSNSLSFNDLFDNKNYDQICFKLKTLFSKYSKLLKVKEEDIKIKTVSCSYVRFVAKSEESEEDFKKRKNKEVDKVIKQKNLSKIKNLEKIKAKKERNKKMLQKCIIVLGADVYEIFDEIQKQNVKI